MKTILAAVLCLSLLIAFSHEEMFSLPLSATEKTQILDTHNANRKNVNPPAKNMQVMVWDDALAVIAQKWAENCTGTSSMIGHNPDRSKNYTETVGENIYATSATTANPITATNAWDAEKQYYNYATNTCQTGMVCGHYTQEVWANSNRVGCGRARCTDKSYQTAIVCDYASAGNYVGQKPYIEQLKEGGVSGLSSNSAILILVFSLCILLL